MRLFRGSANRRAPAFTPNALVALQSRTAEGADSQALPLPWSAATQD